MTRPQLVCPICGNMRHPGPCPLFWCALSRLGARLGNWNDRRHGSLVGPTHRSRLWRPIDRIAGRLYVLGDRADVVTRRRLASRRPLRRRHLRAHRRALQQ
jgi:hypothetical protein